MRAAVFRAAARWWRALADHNRLVDVCGVAPATNIAALPWRYGDSADIFNSTALRRCVERAHLATHIALAHLRWAGLWRVAASKHRWAVFSRKHLHANAWRADFGGTLFAALLAGAFAAAANIRRSAYCCHGVFGVTTSCRCFARRRRHPRRHYISIALWRAGKRGAATNDAVVTIFGA